MGIKERRTKIYLGLFLLSDVNFDFVRLDEKTLHLLDLTMNQKTKSTLSQITKEGLVNRENDVDFSQYQMTEKGFHALCLEFPYFRYLRDTWDNKWRILSYEIPEKKRELRDKLRREVTGWGLGPWHRSFWLTPHPIIANLKELINGRDEEQYVQAFESNHVVGETDVLIEKVWGKSELDKKYRELFKKWHEILSTEVEKPDKFRAVLREYIQIIRQDPGLPKELIGADWIGFEAFNIFKEIRSILLA